jgi:uncharacterized protein involved in tolerance to divalent cations
MPPALRLLSHLPLPLSISTHDRDSNRICSHLRPQPPPPPPKRTCIHTTSLPAAGLESIYVWEGKVNRDEELLLMIKSRQTLVPALTQHVKGMHPYDECEVIALPITGGSASYLKWVMDNTKAEAA